MSSVKNTVSSEEWSVCREPPKDLGTTTPSLHAPSKALLELHNRVQVGTTL